MAAEPRVKVCIAAADLKARPMCYEEQDNFVATWQTRLEGPRYWLAPVESVGFAWSEPEKVFWNAAESRLDLDWHYLSPRRCLRTSLLLNVPFRSVPSGPIDLAPGVFWKIDAGLVWLWHSGRDRVYTLDGVASDMWRALIAFGDLPAAVSYLLSFYDVAEQTLHHDMRGFVANLLEHGLILA